MSWSLGFDSKWDRDIGYGVPAVCDHPRCDKRIDRGLSYVCGGEPYGGERGCGLYFCGAHMTYRSPRGEDRSYQNCKRCSTYRLPYNPKPDVQEWVDWKLNESSWSAWRGQNPDEVAALKAQSKSQKRA